MLNLLEYRTFGLYLSEILLEGLLPKVYLIHWSFFITAYRILTQHRITRREIDIADAYLQAFYEGIETLYGTKYLTIKMHSLLHAADAVRNFGPLQQISAYPFENINGDLIEANHATYQPIEQLHVKYSSFIFMRSILNSMRDADGQPFHKNHPFVQFLETKLHWKYNENHQSKL